jgi:proteasome lid subunit RPN8/RPN11
VDVDEARPALRVPRRIYNELCSHALETLPEECCGLIVGAGGDRFGRLVRCRNAMTRLHHEDPEAWPHDNHSGFYMNPEDYRPWLEDGSEADGHVVAVYHSHVGAGCYLSEEDLAYAENPLFPFADADQIVVAVFDAQVKGVGIFRRQGIGRPFVGCVLEAAGP